MSAAEPPRVAGEPLMVFGRRKIDRTAALVLLLFGADTMQGMLGRLSGEPSKSAELAARMSELATTVAVLVERVEQGFKRLDDRLDAKQDRRR